MEIHVDDQEQQTGPFPAEQLSEMLNSGAITPNAMVWHEGAPDWIQVATFLASQAPPTAPAPVRVTVPGAAVRVVATPVGQTVAAPAA